MAKETIYRVYTGSAWEELTFPPSSHTHDYLPTSGGTLTGTVTMTGGDMIARFVAVKNAGHETSTYDKICTLSSTGYIRYRTLEELKSDLSVPTAYSLPTASSSTLGGVKTTSTVTSTTGLTACPIISGVPYYKDTDTTNASTVEVTNTTPGSATTYYPLYATGVSGSQTARANARLYYYDTGTSGYFNVGNSTSLGGITLHQTNSYYANIYPNALTANRNITLPDKSGTIALTTDIPSVPVTSVAGLTGAIAPADLAGALKGTTSTTLAVGNHTHSYGANNLRMDSTDTTSPYISSQITSLATNIEKKSGKIYRHQVKLTGLTGVYTNVNFCFSYDSTSSTPLTTFAQVRDYIASNLSNGYVLGSISGQPGEGYGRLSATSSSVTALLIFSTGYSASTGALNGVRQYGTVTAFGNVIDTVKAI